MNEPREPADTLITTAVTHSQKQSLRELAELHSGFWTGGGTAERCRPLALSTSNTPTVTVSLLRLPDPMLSRPGPLPSGSGWSFELKWETASARSSRLRTGCVFAAVVGGT
jgi:hypothetical protein